MSDFHVPRRDGESEAVHACRWILARCYHDADFAWYMTGTESLSCAIRGLAEATGESIDDISKSIDGKIVKLQKRRKAEVEVLREKVESLEDRVLELRDSVPGDAAMATVYACALGEIADHLSFVRIGIMDVDIDFIERAISFKRSCY